MVVRFRILSQEVYLVFNMIQTRIYQCSKLIHSQEGQLSVLKLKITIFRSDLYSLLKLSVLLVVTLTVKLIVIVTPS